MKLLEGQRLSTLLLLQRFFLVFYFCYTVIKFILDGRIICGDKKGIHIYDSDGVFIKTVKPATTSGGGVYGVVPLRENGGSMLVICEEDRGEIIKFVVYDKDFDNVQSKSSKFKTFKIFL